MNRKVTRLVHARNLPPMDRTSLHHSQLLLRCQVTRPRSWKYRLDRLFPCRPGVGARAVLARTSFRARMQRDCPCLQMGSGVKHDGTQVAATVAVLLWLLEMDEWRRKRLLLLTMQLQGLRLRAKCANVVNTGDDCDVNWHCK